MSLRNLYRFVIHSKLIGMPSSHISTSDNSLMMLSCPLDRRKDTSYMGVQATIQQQTFLVKWKGEYSYLLLRKPEKQYKIVNYGKLDWYSFNLPNKLVNNKSEPMPKDKCLWEQFLIQPGMLLLLMNSAVTLNLFQQKIVENINQIAKDGIVDYELYLKIIQQMHQQARSQSNAETPYSKHAKFCLQYNTKPTRNQQFACLLASFIKI